MQHKERIRAVLAGKPVDRLPVSVWGHDFLREGTARDLADQTVEKQRAYDYDFVKINPRWTLFAEPWGNRYEPPVEQKFPRLIHRIVTAPEDLERIPHVDPDHPVLTEHVEAVSRIVRALGEDVDCLATVFSPLAVLGLLAGGVGEPLLSMLRQQPDAAHSALAHITRTVSAHADALIRAGASGVFYAPLQWTSLDVCPADAYAEFGEPYDRTVLGAVSDTSFNMLHVCGNHIGMDRFHEFPVEVLNWDNFGEGNPALADVAEASGKIVAGGIPHRRLHKLEEAELADQARAALGGLSRRVMLAGGCGIGATTAEPNRRSVVAVADQIGG